MEKYDKYMKKYDKYMRKLLYIGGKPHIRDDILPMRGNMIKSYKPIDVKNMKCCIKTIGVGSFGKVAKGIDENTGKSVIIKTIKIKKQRELSQIHTEDEIDAKLSISDNTRDRIIDKIEKEIHILQLLDHPNIIKCIGYVENFFCDTDDFCSNERTVDIFMEDICGETIINVAKNMDGLSISLISIYLKQLLGALNYVHKNGIIHMDIKGDNILLSNTGNISLIDFGESILAINNTFKLPYAGTVIYMAPEIIHDNHINTIYSGDDLGKSDIWSLGMVLIEMYVGKIDFPPNIPLNIGQIKRHRRKDDIAEFYKEIYLLNLFKKINRTINKSITDLFNGDISVVNIESEILNLFILDDTISEDVNILKFIDLVFCCLESDYKKRFSAEQLLNHSFFNDKINTIVSPTVNHVLLDVYQIPPIDFSQISFVT